MTDTIKQTAQETNGAAIDTIKAIELRGEEIKNLIIYRTNFDLRLLAPLSEVANSKNKNHFRLRVDLVSKRLYINNNVPVALSGKWSVFTNSNNKVESFEKNSTQWAISRIVFNVIVT